VQKIQHSDPADGMERRSPRSVIRSFILPNRDNKVLAGSMIDPMVEPGHLVKAKAWFDRGLAEAGIKYAPLLPPKTKPPVRLNREEMKKYRDRLKKYYLNVPIRFR
jgi:hypothetical protein